MNEEGMRTTYQALATYRQERDAWEKAYYDLSKKSEDYANSQKQRLNDLEQAINVEREDWKSKIRRSKAPGFGVFAGFGYNQDNSFDLTIGVGLVWKIF